MRSNLLLLALLLSACFNGYSSDDPGGARAFRVHRGAFANDVTLTGELDAKRGAIIAVPPLPTWQNGIKWIAPDGTDIKAGDRVAELDSTQVKSTLEQKRQALIQAEQELTQKENEWTAATAEKRLDLDKKQVDFDKAKLDAAVPEEIVAAREYQDRQVKLSRAKVELAKARDLLVTSGRTIAADRANLLLKRDAAKRLVEEAERALDTMVLRAPRDGVVIIRDHPWEGRKIQEGDMAWVSLQLAIIPELDSMQVVAALADVDDGRIAVGDPATVVLDAFPSLRFRGTVADISAVAQESARASLRRSFRVTVKLDDLDLARMRPGLSARVIVRRESAPAALLAPRAALDFALAKPRARLANGKLVDVDLGACNAQVCVVRGGLVEGDALAAAPAKREVPDA